MTVLEKINTPADLRCLSQLELLQLADEIRNFLIKEVSKIGGHLGPNLGVVELTLGIHRVFDSPKDSIIFDTGHQTYVHKLLTGRKDFSQLRQENGLSGYPCRAESVHDIVENSHASASLSWVDGISRAHFLQGELDRYVVGVIGDGALTGGMAWEALNNISVGDKRKIVIVVNDNGRSYGPTIGGLAQYLSTLRITLDTLRTTKTYESVLDNFKTVLLKGGAFGGFVYRSLYGVKKGVKHVIAPQGMFENLGLKYIGPVDGHDIGSVEQSLRLAKDYAAPVIVHLVTEKGHGYSLATSDQADQFHAIGVMDPVTGVSLQKSSQQSWTSVFAEEIVAIADVDTKIVGITGAMTLPVGFGAFAKKYPKRVLDVGIAEQHAVTSGAGLSYGGLHPVIAIYATFLNRAFDQLLMDAALHNVGMTLILDRAGVTGPDGASHHGMWDLSLLQIVPGIHLSSPRDATSLRQLLWESVKIGDAISVVRFPRGAVGEDIEALDRTVDGVDVLFRWGDNDVLIVAVGVMAKLSLEVACLLKKRGVGVTVVDPRWVLPVCVSLLDFASKHRLVVVVEDGVRVGGVGSRIRQEMRTAGIDTGLDEVGLPAQFLDHGSREQIFCRVGLSAEKISENIVAQVLGKRVPVAKSVLGS